MGIKVTFLGGTTDAVASAQPVTLVPRGAVRTIGDQAYVFVVRGETVERRAVQTAGADGDRLEVRAGLQGGERVVLSPAETLSDGDVVVVGP
jgi:hypothetical protein